MKNSLRYKAIFFDLDDTLIDTFGERLQPALLNVWKTLVSYGLSLSEQEFLEKQQESSRRQSNERFFTELSLLCNDSENALTAAHQAFYGFALEKPVPPLEGVRDMLQRLQDSYVLVLVTAGTPGIQEKKVEMSELGHFFSTIHYVNHQGESKKEAFQTLLAKLEFSPQEVLCVGNRLDDEIQAGHDLRMNTCWVLYGEHSLTPPLHRTKDIADFQIDSIHELVSTCRL